MDIGDLVGAIYMILGVLGIILGILATTLWSEIATILEASGTLVVITQADVTMALLISLLVGVVSFFGGLLTWKRYDAGRIMVCLLAVPTLFAFPMGTVIAVFTWYALLVHVPTKNEFKKLDMSTVF